MHEAELQESLVARLRAALPAGGEEASAIAAELRRRFPDVVQGYREGGRIERERGRFDAAEAIVDESLRRFGPLGWVLAEQARLAEALKRFAEARRLAEELQARFPDEPAGYHIAIAARRALGDLAAALETAERAQARFPDKHWPLAQRVWLTRDLGRAEEAIGLAETARTRFPDEAAGYRAGVAGLRARGRLCEAADLAEEAARRFPDGPRYGERASELRASLKNRRRALALTQSLAEARPAFERPRVVAVLGMGRSGTSLAAHMLAEFGVGLGGPLMDANFANTEGYFEHLEIVGAHDEALRRMGVSWDACWSAAPQTPRLSREDYAETRGRLQRIVERELDANAGAWAFKDPRTLRFLDLWSEIFERLGVEPIWLLCLRDPRAVAASLFARDRIPHAIGELLWIEHVLEALSRIGPRLSLILRYEGWFEAPEAQRRALARAIGRSPEGVASAARAELRHQTPQNEAPALPLSLTIHEALTAPEADLVDLQARARALARRLQRLGAAAFD